MDNLLIGYLFLFAVIFITKILNDKANKKLDADKKAELIDLFSTSKYYSYGILFGILLLFFLNIKLHYIDLVTSMILLFIFIFFQLFISGYTYYHKLKKRHFPEEYITLFITTIIVRSAGLGIFAAINCISIYKWD